MMIEAKKMYLKPLLIDNLKLETNILVAPLAGYTNLPTRLLLRKQGASLLYTEMVSAYGLNYNFEKSARLISSIEEDGPLGIQLFGPDSKTILEAFLKIKEFDYDLIDINCGCSVKKIIKSNSGAYLLKNPDEIYRIIMILKNYTDKPITIKIRSGWDSNSINFLEVLDAAIDANVPLITIHPRTKSMLFNGSANWEHIKMMKEKSREKSNVLIIGNGDLFEFDDVVKMFEITKCDGVMLARGVIENPFLVEEVITKLNGVDYLPPTLEKRIEIVLNHSKGLIDIYGERRGMLEFRKYFSGYMKGYHDIKRVREKLNNILIYKDFENLLWKWRMESIHNTQ